MNISAMLKALPIQAPSSKPMPRLPLRSAVPRVSRRPARVTIPAPMTTPKIPINGLCEISDGKTPAMALATCTGVGGCRTAAWEAIVILRLLSRSDGGGDGKPRTQLRGVSGVVERNLDGNPLHHLGEISGGVVGREQGELRATGGRDLQDF